MWSPSVADPADQSLGLLLGPSFPQKHHSGARGDAEPGPDQDQTRTSARAAISDDASSFISNNNETTFGMNTSILGALLQLSD
uniref:Uncharacterized protein n=1 Tax=Knipowitschia caucasica TaxID=637954 RepID=A0AAV2JL29_KNICA